MDDNLDDEEVRLTDYLTVPQVAERLGITRQAVLKLIKNQTLPSRFSERLGIFLVSKEELDREKFKNRRKPGRPASDQEEEQPKRKGKKDGK